jgi:hypothetical protein
VDNNKTSNKSMFLDIVTLICMLIVIIASVARMAQGQTIDPTPPPAPAQMGQPPQPGQQPNHPILIGPAATRYLDLLRMEDQLTVARYQIALHLAVNRLQAALRANPEQPVPPAQLQALAGDVVRANAVYLEVEAQYLNKYVYPALPGKVCTLNDMQSPVCVDKGVQ